MLKGRNTDLKYGDQNYHIQTEDWGVLNPYIVTRIFNSGRVIYTIKTDYKAWIERKIEGLGDKLQEALNLQHDDTIQEVRSGKWL